MLRRCAATLPLPAVALIMTLGLGSATRSYAQTDAAVAPVAGTVSGSVSGTVPGWIPFAAELPSRKGDTVQAVFRVYSAPEGGEALWSESQSVTVGEDGRYSILLGAGSNSGVPLTLFSGMQGGQGRWLGVSIENAPELPRTPLASVPYAVKSADSASLAGQPARNYVTQSQLAALFAANARQLAAASPLANYRISPEFGASGTANTVALWTDANDRQLGDLSIRHLDRHRYHRAQSGARCQWIERLSRDHERGLAHPRHRNRGGQLPEAYDWRQRV
jgi:hypothetical protein